LKKLNKVNYPFFIENDARTFVEPFNIYDSIQISLQLERIFNDPSTPKVLFSAYKNATIDL